MVFACLGNLHPARNNTSNRHSGLRQRFAILRRRFAFTDHARAKNLSGGIVCSAAGGNGVAFLAEPRQSPAGLNHSVLDQQRFDYLDVCLHVPANSAIGRVLNSANNRFQTCPLIHPNCYTSASKKWGRHYRPCNQNFVELSPTLAAGLLLSGAV